MPSSEDAPVVDGPMEPVDEESNNEGPLAPVPTLLNKGCNKSLPGGTITRQFDFGQFVVLHKKIEDRQTRRTRRVPVVLDDSIASILVGLEKSPNARLDAIIRRSGGLPIHLLLDARNDRGLRDLLTDAATPIAVTRNARKLFREGLLEGDELLDDIPVAFDELMRRRLVTGDDAELLVRVRSAAALRSRQFKPIQLRVETTDVELKEADVDALLATGRVSVPEGARNRRLDVEVTTGLVTAIDRGLSTLSFARDGRLIRILTTPQRDTILDREFVIDDFSTFVVNPQLVDGDGRTHRLSLTRQTIGALRKDGVATQTIAGSEVFLVRRSALRGLDLPTALPLTYAAGGRDRATVSRVADSALARRTNITPGAAAAFGLASVSPILAHDDARVANAPARIDLVSFTPAPDDGSPPIGSPGLPLTLPGTNIPYDPGLFLETPPAQPSATADPVAPDHGLPLALMLAWRQEWVLEGFTRGDLLYTVALAPGEQTTIETSSWQRRSRSLDQSTETDIEQTSELTETTRDSDEVVREMVQGNDFQWQVNGSVHASYRPGVASIDVALEAGVQSNTELRETLKSTKSKLRESTIKTSAKVRSRRITRFTETFESGAESRTARVIRNPNQCHTLTLNFYEVLSNYSVRLEYLEERLRLVVLVDNPFARTITAFEDLQIRTNETALSQALLEPALSDAFSAIRRLGAYKNAKQELNARAAEAQHAASALAAAQQATGGGAGGTTAPANPAEQAVLATIKLVKQAAKMLRNPAPNAASLETLAQQPAGSELYELAKRARSGSLSSKDVFMLAFQLIAEGSSLDLAPYVNAWLFKSLVLRIGGGRALIDALDALASDIADPTTTDAQVVVDAIPPAGTEKAGLSGALSPSDTQISEVYDEIFRKNAKLEPWNYKPRFHDRGIWAPSDSGVVNTLGRLQQQLQQFNSRATAPPLAKDVDNANQSQDAANNLDRLEMSFPLDEMASAMERREALITHLNEHAQYYRYVLFQRLPPSSQLDYIIQNSDQLLEVGMFEPHVVGFQGNKLAIPISPTGRTRLMDLYTFLANDLEEANEEANKAAEAAQQTSLELVLPTPGVSVESWLGECTGCEDFIESSRAIELLRLEALTDQEIAEAARRQALVAASDYGPFDRPSAPLIVSVRSDTQ